MAKVRLGIVGIGHIAEVALLPALLRSSAAAVTAIADPDERGREQALAVFPDAMAFKSCNDLLESAMVDRIFIAAPTPAHDALLHECAAAGVPVLCEKPLFATVNGYARLRERSAGLPSVVHNRLFEGGVRALLQQVASGAIGTPMEIHYLQYMPSVFDGWWTENAQWRLDPHAAGSGVLSDLGYHGIYVASQLAGTGSAEVTSVRRLPSTNSEVDNWFSATLEYDNGVTAHITVAWDTGADVFRIEVRGARGVIALEYPSQITLRNDQGTQQYEADGVGIVDAYRRMIEAWCVEGGLESISFDLAEATWKSLNQALEMASGTKEVGVQ